MHDYFDVLGVASDAPPSEIRRACARRVRKYHPDFHGEGIGGGVALEAPSRSVPPAFADAAIDFLDASGFVDRIQASFFGADR